MADDPATTHTSFAMRTAHARAHAAIALEAVGYRCTFSDGGLLLLVVEHDQAETETVRRKVFATEPHTMVVIV